MTVFRFYLDENVQVVIAEQLRKRGIEAVTVRDLGTLGAEEYHPFDAGNTDGLRFVYA